jgi:uncharacterized protein YfaS (alpha-2-macroglobulin family)
MLRDNDFRHVIAQVDDFLHDVLPAAEARYVENHCAKCAVCEAALHEARKRQAAVESVPPLEASEQLIQQTLKTIDRADQTPSWQRRFFLRGLLPAAAAAVLLLAGFHLYYLNLSPSPYEIRVLGQNQLLAATTGSLRIRLFDRNTGKAAPGIPVRVDLIDAQGAPQQLAAFKTDAEGTGQPRLELPDWPDGDYRLRVTAATGWTGGEQLTEKITLKRSWKLMLTADKPVYQPGQQMHVRSLALRQPDLKPVASREVTFSIVDPKGNVIFKRKDLTSKFGIAAIDCPLASEIIEGPYTIACRVGDTESKQTVEVKKYVLPKFKVEVTPDQRYYQPGQKVRGKVQADYFFGKPVADAEVQLRVLSAGDRELKEVKLKTDAQGTAAFDFPLPEQLTGRLQDDGDARIVLQANVTDPANQKQSRSVSRIVTAQPLKIEVIPETGALVQDIANRVYLFVSYPDGQPAAQARVMVSDRDQELITGSLGVAAYEFTPRSQSMSLTVKAKDANDNVGRRTVTLECGQGTDDFIVRTDKAVYNGGETMRVSVLGGGGQPLFLDFIKDGQTVLTEVVPVKQGTGEYQFDLPADLFGTIEMVAYRYHTAGIPVRKSRVLYVRQAEEIKIAATMDHREYRPGVQAKLRLQLSDKNGKPTPGAISLSAVDEAVFAVLDQMPGMEKVFFSLENKLLQPVYNLYPWSPDLTGGPNDGNRAQFEQALFARTWQRLDNQPQEIKKIHSLQGTSTPHSQQQLERMRRKGLEWVNTGWLVFAGLMIGAGIVHFCFVVRPVQRVQDWLAELDEERQARDEEGAARGLSGGMLAVILFSGALLFIGFAGYMSMNMGAQVAFAPVGGRIGRSGGSADMEMPTAAQDSRLANLLPAQLEAAPVPKAEPPQEKLPPTTDPAAGAGNADSQPAAQPVRIREFFPETLLWKPEVITDDQGRASVNIELADSITTWRLSAAAVTADGKLGAASEPIKVFQPFFVDLNLPISLTRGDEVTVPAVVYNYLSKPQTVTLDLQAEGWFALLNGESATREVELKPNEQKEVRFTLKANKVGFNSLTVKANAGQVGDAIKRVIEIVPDGQRVERVVNGSLLRAVDLNLTVPPEAIDGSPKLFLKIYPSNFSQLVEGIDNIFRMPSGCFEQTSSTTYPNILALDYLRRTGKAAPEVEKKARQYIHLGYQRLLGFEVQGGGFDWYGRPPANRTLTAYGLMEFVDMAKVHEVDPNLISRTRQWLLDQQRPDGSWAADQAVRLAGNVQHGNDADYATTAYIGWAVFDGQPADGDRASAVRQYLLTRRPEAIHNSYLLALTCNALLSLEAASAQPYLKRLEELKRTSADGKLVWWAQSDDQRTMFHGAGQSGNVETTALATLALLRGNNASATIAGALAWLVQQKDASGTWHSTQATVLALKALLAGTGKPVGREQERRIEISLGSDLKRKLVIPADQSDVMQLLDLTEHLKPGDNKLTVNEATATGAGYQVAYRYHVPATEKQAPVGPLAINLDYDRTELNVNDLVQVKATVRNGMKTTAPMVMVTLPVPAGFTPVIDDLMKQAEKGVIGKMQVTGRQLIIYLRGLEPGQPLELNYQLRAVLPVRVTAPAARVYEYYDPAKQAQTAPVQMTVRR